MLCFPTNFIGFTVYSASSPSANSAVISGQLKSPPGWFFWSSKKSAIVLKSGLFSLIFLDKLEPKAKKTVFILSRLVAPTCGSSFELNKSSEVFWFFMVNQLLLRDGCDQCSFFSWAQLEVLIQKVALWQRKAPSAFKPNHQPAI